MNRFRSRKIKERREESNGSNKKEEKHGKGKYEGVSKSFRTES